MSHDLAILIPRADLRQRDVFSKEGARWFPSAGGKPMVGGRFMSLRTRGSRGCFGLLCSVVLAACSASPAAEPVPRGRTESEEAQIAALDKERARLLAEVKRELKALGPDPGAEDKQKREMLEQLLDQIERRMSEEPRTHYWGTRSTEPFASYGNQLLQRLESHGRGRAPKREGRSVYGTATVLFSVRADGMLEEADVTETSAEEIGRHAVALLRELQPFQRFSAEMATKADRIVFAQTFRFFREGGP